MAKDPYADRGEMDVPTFLCTVRFFEPNCGTHQHFWYWTKSYQDGSNLLFTENNLGPFGSSPRLALYDAQVDQIFCFSDMTQYASIFGKSIVHVSSEELETLVHKKEFIDAFRGRAKKQSCVP